MNVHAAKVYRYHQNTGTWKQTCYWEITARPTVTLCWTITHRAGDARTHKIHTHRTDAYCTQWRLITIFVFLIWRRFRRRLLGISRLAGRRNVAGALSQVERCFVSGWHHQLNTEPSTSHYTQQKMSHRDWQIYGLTYEYTKNLVRDDLTNQSLKLFPY